ncbi:hypothetical protein ACF1B0_11740 [Streptomyces anandii]|uniref:hypothetical protein n=1 Tax=Streptomyces anandii TaxID=285454 RepID=UPI0036FD0D05
MPSDPYAVLRALLRAEAARRSTTEPPPVPARSQAREADDGRPAPRPEERG